jgi:acetolactate synthase-1/2/3 large subunit
MPTMRWTGMMTRYDRLPGPQKLVRIDIDPAEMRRLHADAPIVADAGAACAALLDRLKATSPSRKPTTTARKDGMARIARAKDAARSAIAGVQPQLDYLDVIRRVLPRDAFLVPELSQVGFTSYFGYPVLEPRTYVSEGYQGTLGFGFPTSLGVKAAHPNRPVVSITGDGGFMFAVQELATAKQYGLATVTIVFDNKSFGNVLRDQKERYGNRIIGAALDNPNFVALGEAFGIETTRVASPSALEPVLAKAIKAKGPVLIVVDIAHASETSPWAFIHPLPRH